MTQMKKIGKQNWLWLFILLLPLGCSKDQEVNIIAPPSVESKVQTGWSEFTLGHYESAAIQFESALDQDAMCYEAYNGLGWSYFKLEEYSSAIDYFQFLTPLRDTEPELAADAYAGLAVIYMTQDDDEKAVISAWEVLKIAGESYRLAHDPTITSIDIHALAARCLFNMREFYLAQTEINVIDPLFPPSGLVPSATGTETLRSIERITISLSYEDDYATLHLEADRRNLLRVTSVTDTSGQVQYKALYADGERGDIYVWAGNLPPVGTVFRVEYSYVDNYDAYLIALAEKIRSLITI